MTEILPLLEESYSDVFLRMYAPTTSLNPLTRYLYPYEYTNPYKLQEFKIFSINYYPLLHFKEYVFACLLRSIVNSEKLNIYYVSKEYNLMDGDENESYRAGRFVIGFRGTDPLSVFHTYVLLAENPAEAFVKPTFNVELHYLQIRKYRRPGKLTEVYRGSFSAFLKLSIFSFSAHRQDLDPICKLVLDYSNNQKGRLCAMVLRSSYYREKIEYRYPDPFFPAECIQREVSFRTEEGIQQAAGKTYHELMARCRSRTIRPNTDYYFSDFRYLFISRAYKPNEVFLYQQDSATTRIYLENLFIDVSIVTEPLSFNFHDVED